MQPPPPIAEEGPPAEAAPAVVPPALAPAPASMAPLAAAAAASAVDRRAAAGCAKPIATSVARCGGAGSGSLGSGPTEFGGAGPITYGAGVAWRRQDGYVRLDDDAEGHGRRGGDASAGCTSCYSSETGHRGGMRLPSPSPLPPPPQRPASVPSLPVPTLPLAHAGGGATLAAAPAAASPAAPAAAAPAAPAAAAPASTAAAPSSAGDAMLADPDLFDA